MAHKMKKCPICENEISLYAKKCPYCDFCFTRINTDKVKKVGIIAAIVLVIIVIANIPNGSINNDNEYVAEAKSDAKITTENNIEHEQTTNSIKYDKLQKLYLDINPDMSYTQMIDLVKSTGLPYSEEKYNGSRSVQVAFTDGCTAQKYKKESGDYLVINYKYPKNENSINDIIEKYSFDECSYVPYDSNLSLKQNINGNSISKLGTDLKLDKNMSKEEQLDYYFDNK